jgi:hypothetical protein
MKRRRKLHAQTVAPREFIRIWQTSSSVAEVASKVRRTKNACRVRAFHYRERGVPLKDFPPVEIEPPDWDELAEYARELAPPKEDNDDETEEGAETPDRLEGGAHDRQAAVSAIPTSPAPSQ